MQTADDNKMMNGEKVQMIVKMKKERRVKISKTGRKSKEASIIVNAKKSNELLPGCIFRSLMKTDVPHSSSLPFAPSAYRGRRGSTSAYVGRRAARRDEATQSI